MSPARLRRSALSVALAVSATLVVATGALAAPTWSPAVDVREAEDIALNDAAFARRNVAIAWDEPDSPRKVGIRASVDAGSGFGPIEWFAGARRPAVVICGSELHTAMEKAKPGTWLIKYGARSIDGAGFDTRLVSPSRQDQSDPDVACTRGRVFVSWFEEEAGEHALYVSHALRTGGPFSDPIFLGMDDEVFFGSSLAVAGVAGMAYAVYQKSDGDLYFRRWSIGPGPDFTVTPHAEQEIAPGTPGNEASYAVIDAAGDKVAVSWFKCKGIFARVSDDGGQTWGPIRKLVDHVGCEGDFIAVQSSIAIRGDRIALAYHAAGFFSGEVRLIRTTNNFASFSDKQIADRSHFEHLVGFVRAGGEWRLAAAFQRNETVRFRRQV